MRGAKLKEQPVGREVVRTLWLLLLPLAVSRAYWKGALRRRSGEHANRACRKWTACWNASEPTVAATCRESVTRTPQRDGQQAKGARKSGTPNGAQCFAHRGLAFRCSLVGPQDDSLAVIGESSLFAQGISGGTVEGRETQ